MLSSLHTFYTPLIGIGLLGVTVALQVYCGVLTIENAGVAAHFATDSKDRIKAIQKEFLINRHNVKALAALRTLHHQVEIQRKMESGELLQHQNQRQQMA